MIVKSKYMTKKCARDRTCVYEIQKASAEAGRLTTYIRQRVRTDDRDGREMTYVNHEEGWFICDL